MADVRLPAPRRIHGERVSNGKGSRARPLAVDTNTFARNWERTFRSQSEHSIYANFPKTTLVRRTDFETIDITHLVEERREG